MKSYKDWPKNKFKNFREKTDPIADKVIKDIIECSDVKGINDLFLQLRENDDINDASFPESVKNYFKETSVLPSWIDEEKIAAGQNLFAAYGPEISLCLLCKSLPEAYACANGAKVLYVTGRMTEQDGSLDVFTRRLMETAQFVVNVCIPDGLSPGGKGIITAQKVRLIHAAIRYYIKKHQWPEKYGEPINQQDMAGTLQSFSTLILEGLETLKIDLTKEEKDGYYHCWRVIGFVMGVEDELNPESYEDGYALGKAIFNDQRAASKEGTILTQAVCKFLTDMLPGNIFNHTPEAIIRHLVGDDIAKDLQLNSHTSLINKIIPRLIGLAFHATDEIQDRSSFISKIVSHVNMYLLQSILKHSPKNINI